MVRALCVGSLALLTAVCQGQDVVSRPAAPEQRAVWAHYPDIQNPEAIQRTVERLSAAHLNAIYILVWYNGGQAAYRSALSPMQKGTPEGFDPLGALIAAAHPRGIAVHAWFVNGSYGWDRPGHVFTQHPDWELQAGAPTQELWYDLGKPVVREFQRDVMLECLRDYDVDGIHFDYIRFAGRGMCYCDYCQGEVEELYGIPPLSAANPSFPLACQMSGNPLDKPTTAQVLATFDDGVPALTLNRLGQGEAALLNWHANDTGSPAVSAFAKQLLERFGVAAATVYQLRNSETTARYGLSSQEEGIGWLRGLGCKPEPVEETQLDRVPAGAAVVLQCQYLMSSSTAAWLEQFVAAGGHALFIDGPVFAISDPSLQRVLGLSTTAPYFSALRAITPAPNQDLIKPGSPVDLRLEERRAGAWEQYWRGCVTDLVRQVHSGAKTIKPKAWVSAAVFYNRQSADSVCQDWYGWLQEGIVDYVLPMAYVEDSAQLKAALDEWQAFDPGLERILPGLSLYTGQGAETVTRDLALVASQQELCRSYHARGICYFCLEYLSPELQEAFAAGPYAHVVEPYYPGQR